LDPVQAPIPGRDIEIAARVPVVHDADVVVTGGGPGGFAAALRVARMGARTVMVEKYDMPGGVHTIGLQGAAGRGVGGIHSELMERFAAEGCIYTVTEADMPHWAGNPLSHYESYLKPGSPFSRSSFNPEGAGCVMVKMLEEAGVTAMYGTAFVDVAMEKSGSGESRIAQAIVHNASGTQAVRGLIFIDGSGTAEVAARAGVPFVRGGGPQPASAHWDGVERPIPGAILWIMSGIRFEKVVEYQQREGDPRLDRLIARARAAGDIPDHLYRPRMGGENVYGTHYIGHPTLDMSPIQGPGTFVMWMNVPYEWGLHMDDDAADAARARASLRELIQAEASFLRKYVPGFEQAFISHVGRYVGVRDGRHPLGEYRFTIEDARAERRFPDAISRPMKKTFFWDGYKPYTFDIPYRCFLPKNVDNLLLTGASLSFAYETIFMVMRNFPWCTQTGEVAGYAAGLALERGVMPKALHWMEPYF
jgi:hypothetical protein